MEQEILLLKNSEISEEIISDLQELMHGLGEISEGKVGGDLTSDEIKKNSSTRVVVSRNSFR